MSRLSQEDRATLEDDVIDVKNHVVDVRHEIVDVKRDVVDVKDDVADDKRDAVENDAVGAAPLEQVDRRSRFQVIAFILCVLFGLAMIANTQPAGDGPWFWYGEFLNAGKHLYGDLHLAQQPLFVLETSAFMAALGKGWLVSRIPAVLHMVAYCLALLLLVRKTDLSDARRAILLACAFLVTVSSVYYRFDDYHVLADCFVAYSVLALLSLRTSTSVRRSVGLLAILGVLSGLTLTTRLNDGAALVIGVVLAIVCLTPVKKLVSLLLFGLATGLTLLLVVGLSGDSLRDYAHYSVFKAAAIKGDGGSVLLQPLCLPANTIQWLVMSLPSGVLVVGCLTALTWTFLLLPLARRPGWWGRVLAVVGVGVVGVLVTQLSGVFDGIGLLANLAAVLVLLAVALGIWVAVKFVRWVFDPKHANLWDRRGILLLIPLGQMAAAAMSSGGSHSGMYGPVGVFIVLLAICSPIHFKANWPRDLLFAFAVLLIISTAHFRFTDPYSWHTYTDKPMFEDRTWYQHPAYGPMIIDRDELQMIQPVCQALRDSGSDNELLSLPFPYANYFCATPPWHGYVQTFFDTTSEQSIRNLMDDLRHSPPKWIFYQRQLATLRLHEGAYNHGKPLAQRYLDQLIERNISEGKWRVAYTSDYGQETLRSRQVSEHWDNEWILIQTR